MTKPLSAEDACANTDRELWRECEGDYFTDSIHVTQDGQIGINCDGYVIVMPVRKWHKAAVIAYDLIEHAKKLQEIDEIRTQLDMQTAETNSALEACDELRTENERLQKDAARYKWLRDKSLSAPTGTPIPFQKMHGWVVGPELDAAIDAAMKGEIKQ